MLIGLVSYYPISLNEESEGEFLRENGNTRWLEFYKYLESKKGKIEFYKSKNHFKYDLIIFREIPRLNELIKIKLNNHFIKKIPLILLIEETPLARGRGSLLLRGLYDKVLLATNQKNYKFKKYPTKTFLYGNLPNRDEIKSLEDYFLIKDRNKLICYISSNKSCLNRKSTYRKRYKLVKNLTERHSNNFDLFGFGWDKFSIPMDFPFIAIAVRFKKVINYIFGRFIKKIKSKGQISSKKKVMSKYKFCLAIEPYIGEPFCALEKIFDPMLAGCIPVYMGLSTEILKVPNNTFISINKNINADQLIKILQSYSDEDLQLIRENIFNYLCSKEADIYRYNTFAKFLYNSFKEIIKS